MLFLSEKELQSWLKKKKKIGKIHEYEIPYKNSILILY